MSDVVLAVPTPSTEPGDGVTTGAGTDEQPQTNSKPRIDVAIVIDLVGIKNNTVCLAMQSKVNKYLSLFLVVLPSKPNLATKHFINRMFVMSPIFYFSKSKTYICHIGWRLTRKSNEPAT